MMDKLQIKTCYFPLNARLANLSCDEKIPAHAVAHEWGCDLASQQAKLAFSGPSFSFL